MTEFSLIVNKNQIFNSSEDFFFKKKMMSEES